MRKEKAFTLIELMGVLVIIGMLTVILIPVINNTIKDNKEELYNRQLDLIKMSAKNLTSDNQYILPEEDAEEVYITLGQLRNLGYSEETIINPLTNENFPNDLVVMIIKREKDYDYEIKISDNKVVTASGITVSYPSKKYIKKGAISSYIITSMTSTTIDNKESNYYVDIEKSNIIIKGDANDDIVKYKLDGNNGLYKLTISGGGTDGYLYFNFRNLKGMDEQAIDTTDINSELDDVDNNKQLIVDNTAPTCSWSGENTTWTKNNVTVTVTGSDSGSGMNPAQQSTSWVYASSNQEVKTANKSYTISDNAGNTTTCSKTINVYHDTKAPTCSWSGENYTWSKYSVTVKVTGNDSGSGMDSTKQTYSWIYASSNEEVKTVDKSYTVSDNAGNETTCSKAISVYHDTKAPTCSWSGENYAWSKYSVTVTVTGNDSGSGMKSAQRSSSWTYASYDEEVKTAVKSYTVSDNVGNETTCSKTIGVYHDTKAPTCNWTGENTTWTKNNVTVTVTGSDNGSGMDSTKKTYSWLYNLANHEVKTADKSYTISDTAGNETTCSKAINVYRDTKAPTISSTSISSCANNKRTITVEALIDSSGIAGYAVTSSSTTPTSFTATTSRTWTSSAYSPGTYYVWVKDNVGNVSSKSVTLSSCDSTGPTITFSNDGSSGWVSEAITKVTATDSSGIKSIQYGWSTSNSSTSASTSTTSGTTLTSKCGRTSGSDGECYLYVKACDNNNNCSTKRSQAFKVDVTAPTITTISHTTCTNGLNYSYAIKDTSSGLKKHGYIHCDKDLGTNHCYDLIDSRLTTLSSATTSQFSKSGTWCNTHDDPPKSRVGYAFWVKGIDAVGNIGQRTTGVDILPYETGNCNLSC